MSAFVVDREHVKYLVDAAMKLDASGLTWANGRLEPGHYDTAAFIAQMLWSENVASVAYRYNDPAHENLPGPIGCSYIFGDWGPDILGDDPEPVAVLKACDGYEYQSCEHPGWEGSDAKEFVDSLRRKAVHCLCGYEEADWSIEGP